jgi:hypothetical protein
VLCCVPSANCKPVPLSQLQLAIDGQAAKQPIPCAQDDGASRVDRMGAMLAQCDR